MNKQTNMDNIIEDELLTASDELLIREALIRTQPELQPDVDKEWRRFAEREGIMIPVHRKRNIWIASVAAACIAIAFFVLGQNINKVLPVDKESVQICEVVTSDGQRCQLTLPDGTKIWLGSGSKLKYPAVFNGKDRRVELHGEAFFDVRKDSLHPFVVNTPYIITRVYGTQFNIRCYTEEDCNVRLISGSIEVTPHKKRSEHLRMTPGEEMTMTAQGETSITQYDPESIEHLSWQSGEFEFDDTELGKVLDELSRWYKVPVMFHDTEASHQKVHIALDRNMPLDEAIELLNSLSLSHIYIHDGTIFLGEK